ncbi:MAG: chromate resistance protein [Alphaproteobacteria bacterium]
MKWITRSHVHVDRVACPWLITRFLDSDAELLFVPRDKVLETALREGAISYDTKGADYDHEGDLCTFDVLIRAYGLTDKPLLRLARVVNAADTNRLDRDPLAPGLEALAVGYALRHPEDRTNLARQFEMYDSLYAWCVLDVAKGRA